MSSSPTPWILLILAVIAVLVFKGYIRMPGLKGQAVPQTGPAGYTSHQLGVMFAQAKRREAEEELAALFAQQAGESLKASFKAPFSPATEPAPVEGEEKAGSDKS